jgi:hypothetical protein
VHVGRVRLATPTTASILAVLVLALACAVVPLTRLTHQSELGATSGVPLLAAFAGMGVLVARRQPRHPMGWILLGIALGFVLNTDASDYSILDYRIHGGRLPLGFAAILLQPAWAPAILLCGVAILIFPHGRLPANGLRYVAWAVFAVGAVWMLGAYAIAANALLRHAVHVDSTGNLTATDHPRGHAAWWGLVQDVFFPLLFASWVLWLVWQVRSYRRSTGERRLQLKWLLGGGAIFGVSLPLLLAAGSGSSTVGKVLSGVSLLGLAALPVSIGVGVLRFRLYEIDRLVSRTISYAVLTGTLVAVYLTVVTVTTRALPLSSPVGVATSTLAAAALFYPLRLRIQHVVDRRFNRARYDAETTVAAFAGQLRDAIDLDTVQLQLTEAVERTLAPGHVSLWIQPPSSG